MAEDKPTEQTSLPEEIAELLEPIEGDSAAGQSSGNSEEYFKLDMEIGKVTPDYNICLDLAKAILTEQSKDLRVASWMAFAWYRRNKLPGFLLGVQLMLEMMRKFGDKLFPEKPAHRAKSLLYLNTSRFVKLLEKEEISSQTAPVILELHKLYQELMEEAGKQFPENVPELNELRDVIAEHVESAEKAEPHPEAAKEAPPPESGEAAPSPEKKKAAAAAPSPAPGAAQVDGSVGSEKDAVVAFKKALRFMFNQENPKSKQKPYLFGISRSLIWSRMGLPVHEDNKSDKKPPDPVIISRFQQWFSNQEWDTLISNMESSLLDEDSTIKYWLTGQRLEAQALENSGGSGPKAVSEIKFHIAKLIKTCPDLPKIKFSDGTPFADKETIDWIEDEIKPMMSGGKGGESILPPIMGEDYDPVNQEYQQACEQLPDKFEENLANMQKAISSEHRRKGHFLRELNLANFCIKAREYELAKVHLKGLLEKIEAYQLSYWEPALCAAAWQSMYLVNQKLLEAEPEDEERESLEKDQRQLFSKIGNYDGLLALKLADRNKNKGE